MKQVKTVTVPSKNAVKSQEILRLNGWHVASWSTSVGHVTFKCIKLPALKRLVLVLALFVSFNVHAEVIEETVESRIIELADSNGFKPSKRIVNAIVNASEQYNVDALELTAIGIVETGLGKYAKTRKNRNGTFDKGLFQINTINEKTCVEYNLDSAEGSALCAAKLLSRIKSKHNDYLGRYHSKTPSKKATYSKKITKVLASVTDR